MKYVYYLALSILLIGCSSEETPTKNPEVSEPVKNDAKDEIDKADLVDIENGVFTEYYPGKTNIKFQGPQDAERRRHGEWKYYSIEGEVLSTTVYKHGTRHGHTLVKHDNGQISFTGEYKDGKKIGIWTSYARDGALIEAKDMGGK